MENYTFNFEPKDCNKIYFKELFLLMKMIDPESERFNRIKKKDISKLKIKCENDFNSCKTDEFFFENKKQIILGRFFDTIGCFECVESKISWRRIRPKKRFLLIFIEI